MVGVVAKGVENGLHFEMGIGERVDGYLEGAF